MMHLVRIVVTIAALVGVTALAVERFGDRETFVPPPDAIAEGFVREVVTKRYDQAQTYLEEPVPQELLEALQSRLGDPATIEAETVTQDRERALATVRVSSARHSEAVSFALTFDKEWKIELQ